MEPDPTPEGSQELAEPDRDSSCELNLVRFIARARNSPALGDVVWSSVEWNLSERDPAVSKIRKHRKYSPTLTFTTRETSQRGQSRVSADCRTPIAEPFADFAKAVVRNYAECRAVSLPVLRRLLTALQFLEHALRAAQGQNEPCLLTQRHFRLAEESMERDLAKTTAYRVSVALVHVSDEVDRNGLSRCRIEYQTRLSRPLDGDELTEEGQTIGLKKMVSDEVLDALAQVSANPANDRERLIIRMVDLMVCGGFRIGEVLTLPVDCWIVQPESSKERDPATGKRLSNEGILYAAEKARDFRPKWLPRESVELARRAVDELTALCAPAREMARWMERNPGRLEPFAELDPNSWILGTEACRRLGLRKSYWTHWELPKRYESGRPYFKVGAVEGMYCGRIDLGPIYTSPSGRTITVSGALIVIFKNQLHATKSTLTWLPRNLGLGEFSAGLSRREYPGSPAKGILARFGLRATSKQFRHWLNTMAENAGLSDIHLAKWMGRRDIRQNVAYKHGTVKQRVDDAKRLIIDGQAFGPVARTVASLPLAERKDYLDAAVEVAHATPFGMCLHNFASTPCPMHHECLRGCGEYLRIKGDIDQRRALLELRAQEQLNIERSQLALSDGFNGADKWIAASRERLHGIDEALAVDDDEALRVGETVAAFSGAKSKHLLL